MIKIQTEILKIEPEDVIIFTYGKELDFSEINNSLNYLKSIFPNHTIIGNREDMILNVEVVRNKIFNSYREEYPL